MSHSLHRRGSSEDLRNDFVLLVTAASGINNVGSKAKLLQVLDLVWEIGPINTGSNETGTILSGVTVEEIKQGFTKVPRVRCCFDSEEKIREIIDRLIEMDLGISVTISGNREFVEKLCRDKGVKPDSVNFSLDIWGNKEKLPSEETLEMLTMCGHGLISKQLVEETIKQVESGEMSPQKGAIKIGSPCVCGLFNPTRAIQILKRHEPNHE